MSTIATTYFDGETLQGRPATLELGVTGEMKVRIADGEKTFPLDQVRVSDRLGDIPRFVYLTPRETLEVTDNDTFDAYWSTQRRGRIGALIHWLETHNRVATLATLWLVVLVAGGVKYGLPALARHTAAAVPAAVEEQAGRVALVTFNRMLGASNLSHYERGRVQYQLTRLSAVRPLRTKPRVEFRSMGGLYANAFALPGGIIIISDELVRLNLTNDEIAAVLAHELSHLERRHGIQSLLRNSYAFLTVGVITGDLSTLTSLAGTLPVTLLNNGYDREFEREADADAKALLIAARIDPQNLVSILEKLEKARPASGRDYSYLSTHPSTAERIRELQAIRH
ncbi:MAG TPA: M48 family metallopeptidase [Opitutaceae bacterium]|nr:M48 family metallopeptidase [Opitutaceae bacterium]